MGNLRFVASCWLPLAMLARVAAAGSPGDAVAGTYDILICKGVCSFLEPANVLVKGQIVLFADKLEKADLKRFDENRFSHHYPSEPLNGCFSLQTMAANSTYAGLGKIGLTSWTLHDNQYSFSLGRSVDAGYEASVVRTMTGLDGTGSSWGAGVAAPKDPSKETVIARRTGAADVSNCTFQTAEEREFRRLLADPAREEIFAIEKTYRQSLFASLQASASPRDWAMAGWLQNSEAGEALILRARKAAPDDKLIAWIALNRVHSYPAPVSINGMSGVTIQTKELDLKALEEAQRSEPENAVPWLMVLRNAVNQNDEAAETSALAHLSAARYFNDHAVELLKAQLDAYREHPLPDAYFDAVGRLDAGWRLHGAFTKEVAPYYENHYPFADIGIRNLFMSDSPQGMHELFVVCTQRPNRSAERTRQCAKIGTMLSTASCREDVRYNGSMLLNDLAVFDAGDIRRALVSTWIASQSNKIHQGDGGNSRPHVGEDVAFIQDWILTGNEVETMRRDVQRAGLSLTPPAEYELNKTVLGNFEKARLSRRTD